MKNKGNTWCNCCLITKAGSLLQKNSEKMFFSFKAPCNVVFELRRHGRSAAHLVTHVLVYT